MRALLRVELASQGYRVKILEGSEFSEERLDTIEPDLLILDSDHQDDLTLAEALSRLRGRKTPNLATLTILTATEIPVEAAGSVCPYLDNVLQAPFSKPLLLARIRELLKRSNPAILDGVLVVDDIVLDQRSQQVMRKGTEIKLATTEYRLLEFMMMKPRTIFSRKELVENVWKKKVKEEERVVDVYIRRLRKSLDGVGRGDLIKTIRGRGYAIT